VQLWRSNEQIIIPMSSDDLVVTPMSSFAAISHLNSSNIPVSDVEEKVVKIGLSEVNQ